MSFEKIDTSTPEGFAFRLEREYGLNIQRNRDTMNALSAGWWELCPIAGIANSKTGDVTFTFDPEKEFPDDLLNYALCHEVGHILEAREQGMDLYIWRYQVEQLEVETEAWDRADAIMAHFRHFPSDHERAEMNVFRQLCLGTYEEGAARPEHQAKVDRLLEDGNLDSLLTETE